MLVARLLRLAKLTDNADYYAKAERLLQVLWPLMNRWPRGFASTIAALDFLVEGPNEIAIAGRAGAKDTQRLLQTVRRHYLPNSVIALVDPTGGEARDLARKIPLLADKTLRGGKATFFVCRNFACKFPVTDPGDVAGALELEKKQ